MQPPFGRDEFLGVFVAYCATFGRLALAFSALGVTAVLKLGKLPKLALVICAGLWLWMAIAYFAISFASLSAAGYAFAVFFAIEGFLLLRCAQREAPAPTGTASNGATATAVALMVYSLAAYPLIGIAVGQRYPAMPTFGLPCPTTIFTFGVLAWWGTALPARLLVIPTVWALVGTSAGVTLGIVEDLALLPAAVLVLGLRARARGADRNIRTAY